MTTGDGVAKSDRRAALVRLGVLMVAVSAGRGFAANGHGEAKWANNGNTHEQVSANLLRFFGNEKGRYLGAPVAMTQSEVRAMPAQTLGQQFVRVFSGIPLPERDLGNGYQLLGSSEFRNVANKAFAVTPFNSSDVVIAALLHYNCGVRSKDPMTPSCNPTPTLTVFYPAKMAPQVALTGSVTEAVKQIIIISNSNAPKSSMFHVTQFKVDVRRFGAKR